MARCAAMQLTCTATRVLGQPASTRRAASQQRRVAATAEPQKVPAGVNRWADFSLGHPNSANRGIDVTGLPPTPAAPKPAAAPAPAAPAASSATAEPAPVPYAARRSSPQPAPLGSLAKMHAPPAKPAAPAAAAPVRSSSPAAAKWDHATRVMPAGSAAPTTPTMDAAAFSQAASKPAAPSAPPAGVNRWADFSLGNPDPKKRGIDVTGLPHVPAVDPVEAVAAAEPAPSEPAAPSAPPAGVNRWADFSLGNPDPKKRGIDVTF